MDQQDLQPPFVWPDSRRLAGCAGPRPNLKSLLLHSQLVTGMLTDMTESEVAELEELISEANEDSSSREDATAIPIPQVRLIVTLYPICPTNSASLQWLLSLQEAYPNVQVRLATCGLTDRPQSVIAHYPSNDALPVLLVGTDAGFERRASNPTDVTIAFTPEPVLATEWARWFDVRWVRAAPLTAERTQIPHLVLPKGTIEAARQWETYSELLSDESTDGVAEQVVTVDAATGEVAVSTSDGSPVATVSAECKLPKVPPIYRTLADLLRKGHLVSVDKSTRLRPLEVSVKPSWFGLQTLTQIGSVKRQVSYSISALSESELKQLENRRTKTAELLKVFSFALADGQRWMPETAEKLYKREYDRINKEAAGIISSLVSGDLTKFLAARREQVRRDADQMYRNLFPDRSLTTEALDEIMEAIRSRMEQAMRKPFLPLLSFSRIGLPQPQDDTWKSGMGLALRLLLDISRYPRKACEDGPYFARGLAASPSEVIAAMNVLSDSFVVKYADQLQASTAKSLAKVQLDEIEEIDAAEDKADSKCELLLEVMGLRVGQESADPEVSRLAGGRKC